MNEQERKEYAAFVEQWFSEGPKGDLLRAFGRRDTLRRLERIVDAVVWLTLGVAVGVFAMLALGGRS